MLALSALLLLAAAPQQSAPFDVNGIMNGDFERLDPTGTISNTLQPADGGYWNGAEGRTIMQLNNRFLRFPGPTPDFVFQKIGSPKDQTSNISLDVRVRVRASNDEARLTVTNGGGQYRSLLWDFKSSSTSLDAVWSFYEGTAGNYTPLSWNPPSSISLPYIQSDTTGNHFDASGAYISGTPLFIGWHAPAHGTVRVLVRPWVADPINQVVDVNHDILTDINDIFTAPAPVPVRSDTILKTDSNGIVIASRLNVDTGSWIFLRLSQATPTPGPVQVKYSVLIGYDKERLTYRFGPNLNPANAPPNAYLDRTVPATAWTSFAPPLTALAIGTDFASAYPGVPLVAPLEVELSGATTNTDRVDFDDVVARVRFESESLSELSADILAEARWARDNHRLIRDRPNAGPAGMIGLSPSPYAVHELTINNGAADASSGNSTEPLGLWSLLSRRYDDLDYDDWTWIREHERQQKSPVGLPYTKYDCMNDVYKTASLDYLLGVDPGIGNAVDYFTRTNDATWLDIVYDACQVAAKTGVVMSDPVPQPAGNRIGLVVAAGFDINTGLVIGSPVDHLQNHTQLGGAVALIRGYVACKLFNASHTPVRYPPSEVDHWLQVAQVAILKARDLKDWGTPAGSQTPWGGKWQAYGHHLNDLYGYQGIDATSGYLALETLGTLTAVELQARDILRDDFVIDGAEYFVGLLEQSTSRGAFNDGDQARAWPHFLHLIQVNPQNPYTSRYGNELIEAALNCQRFQYPDGIWTNGPLEWFHYLETAGGFGGGMGAPVVYVGGMSAALQVPWIKPADKDHIYAALRQFQYTAIQTFKKTYGYAPSVAIAQSGADALAGAEWRTINNYLEVLDVIDASIPLPSPPTAVVAPATLSAAPLTPATFQFTITLPSSASQDVLHDALYLRTRIELWTYPTNSCVKRELWPSLQGQFSAPTYSSTAPQVSVTYTDPSLMAGAGHFKITVRTWDLNDRWTQDTSYQEW